MADETANKLSKHKSKYKVESFSLVSKEFAEPIQLNPYAIKNIMITHDFNTCLQPVFEMAVVLPPLIVSYIKTHKSSISFLLRLQIIDYVYAEENFMLDKDYKKNGTDDICNTKFILFTVDEAPVPNLAEYKSVTETIDGKENANILYSLNEAGANVANYTQEYTLFLWKESDIYRLRDVCNFVFNNVTVGDAAVGVLANCGFSDVLMVPGENAEVFSQLVIPPMNVMNVFSYLQTTYGLYENDVVFFNDIYRTYLLDKSGECKAFEDGEYKKTIFSVVDSVNADSMDLGTNTLDEKMEFHNKVNIEDISVRSLSTVNDVLYGNSKMYIDSRNNTITTISGGASQRGDGCVVVTIDQEGSQYTKSRIQNMVSEMDLNIRINVLTDYNYFAFTPNKEFVFAFSENNFYQYNGYYRLMKATHVFSREGAGELLAITGSFEFTRKKELNESERLTIEADVFQTAQVTEEGKQQAASAATENNAADPSYQQSQDNQVAEGKQEPPKELEKGSNTPESVGDTTNQSAHSSAQTISPETLNANANKSQFKTNRLNGSPAPIPLDEKNK